MKLFMVTDIEGLSGVYYWDQTRPGNPAYDDARELLMGDVLAAVEGAHDGGADEIVIYDMHEKGRNLIPGRFPAYVRPVLGKPPILPEGLRMDETYGGLMLVGNHAKTYTKNAVLCHAYWMPKGTISVNGVEVGEIGMEAMIAGQRGVPLLMVSGDLAAKAEALALSPDTRFAAVKESAGYENTALCYPFSNTKDEIYKKAKESVENAAFIKPVALQAPYTVDFHFEQRVRGSLLTVTGMELLSPSDCRIRGDDLQKLWEAVNLACCDWLD